MKTDPDRGHVCKGIWLFSEFRKEKPFADIEAAQNFADIILHEYMGEPSTAMGPFVVKSTQSASRALRDRRPPEIWLSTRRFNRMAVLHEMAHILCPPRSGHGKHFLNTLYNLVSIQYGRDGVATLKACITVENIWKSTEAVANIVASHESSLCLP